MASSAATIDRVIDQSSRGSPIGQRETASGSGSYAHRVGRLSAFSFLALALERVFALALIAVVAALFGVSASTDTYYLALIVPASVGFALSEGLYTAFLPVFGHRERPTRAQLAGALRIAVPLTAAMVAAYVLVVLAVGPRQIEVWLAFAGVIFAGPVGGVYAAFVTAQRRYALATLRVPFMTVVALATALVLLAAWDSLAALAVAMTVGQLGSLGLLVVRERSSPSPRGDDADRRGPGLRVLGPAGSVVVATLVGAQLIVLVERFLASTLAAGAVTVLVNARGFVLVPVMVAQAIGSGVFPAASERYRTLGRDALAPLGLVAVRLAAVAALVSAAYIAICRTELVEVVLQRGKFGEDDTIQTARLISIMAPSLFGISVGAVAGKALFGVGRQRFVAFASAATVALYVGAALAFRELWGVDGLAAAFLVSSLATGLVLAVALAKILRLAPRAVLREWLLAPAVLAAVFAAAAAGVWLAIGSGDGGMLSALATLAAAGVAGLAALGVAVVTVRGREYELLRRAWQARTVAVVDGSVAAPGR